MKLKTLFLLIILLTLLPSVHAGIGNRSIRDLEVGRYYWSVAQNETLQPYLECGLYTRCDNPEINELGEELWVNDSVYFSDGNISNPIRTDDAIYDYIQKTKLFTWKEIEYGTIVAGRRTADDVLQTMSGDCDDITFLICSLMREKGIPCRIEILWVDNDIGSHTVGSVWHNESWLKIDRNCNDIGMWCTPYTEITTNTYSSLREKVNTW